jgi:hypothetical protein
LRRMLVAALIKRGVMQVQANQFGGGPSPFGTTNQEFGTGPDSHTQDIPAEDRSIDPVIIEGEYKKEE